MKKRNCFYALVAAAAFSLVGCQSNTDKEQSASSEVATEEVAVEESKGEISFDTDEFDFGTVDEGAVVEHVYTFTNTGTEPVIVNRVTASCGCTTPSYTSTPVAPGKTGEVRVSFDSKGQVGKQQKIITVVSTSKTRLQTLQLKGEVK